MAARKCGHRVRRKDAAPPARVPYTATGFASAAPVRKVDVSMTIASSTESLGAVELAHFLVSKQAAKAPQLTARFSLLPTYGYTVHLGETEAAHLQL